MLHIQKNLTTSLPPCFNILDSDQFLSASSSATTPIEKIVLPVGDKKEQKKIRQQLLADFLDLAERIIDNLFCCGKTEGNLENNELPSLSDFGWMIIHRCQLSFANVILAILYLIRLKQKHPSCKGGYGSGHRLFLAALIVGNKYLYDDAYHNHTWAEVTQGIFKLNEVNRMEFELIYFLNFTLNVTYTQWYELVDLLDNKLHTELINVGCLDSKRYRLSYECGIRYILNKKPTTNTIKLKNITNINSNKLSSLSSEIYLSDLEMDSDSDIDTKAIEVKQKMAQSVNLNKDSTILPSPLQGPLFNLKKNNKPTPTTPKKMLHLPLHKSNTPPKSSLDLLSPDNNDSKLNFQRRASLLESDELYANAANRQRRGSLLKYEVNDPSNITDSNLIINTSKPKPLPTLPNRIKPLNSTASLISIPENLQFGQQTSSIGLKNNPMVYHITDNIHPRRKSLPAFPIATNATSHVSFKVAK